MSTGGLTSMNSELTTQISNKATKMTEYLNLSEQQAEKLFPRMRRQRVKMKDYFDTEKELFDSYLTKIKKGEKISQSDVDALYKKMDKLSGEKNVARMKFFKSTF